MQRAQTERPAKTKPSLSTLNENSGFWFHYCSNFINLQTQSPLACYWRFYLFDSIYSTFFRLDFFYSPKTHLLRRRLLFNGNFTLFNSVSNKKIVSLI